MTAGDARTERQALIRILETISARRPAHEAYRLLADEARHLVQAATVAVGLALQGSRTLDFVAVSGRDPAEIIGLRVSREDTLADPALRSGQPVILRSGTVSGDQSGAIVPILYHGVTVGAIIAVMHDGESVFDDDAIEVLKLCAGAAALIKDWDRATRTLAEKQRELAALYDASRSITSTVNVQSVLDAALDAICRHIPVQSAAVYLLNDDRTHLYITASRGLSEEEREAQLATDTGFAAEILAGGQGRIFDDLREVGEADTISPTERARALVATPVRSATETLGLLTVTSSQPKAYHADDLRLLDAVASLAGIAIQNATLYEDATQRAEAANALFTFSQRVGATLNIREILECVADTTITLLGVDRFAALMREYQPSRLVPLALRGLDTELFSEYQPKVGEGIAGWVCEWSCPTAVADVAADARNRSAPIHPFGVVSCMCVPVTSGDTVYGALLAMSSRRRFFTVAELELLYTIANQAALAITNASAYERARQRALMTRRYFRRFAEAIASTVDTEQVLRLFADVTLNVLAVDRCAIYAVRRDELVLKADSRLPGRVPADSRVRIGEGLTGTVAAKKRTEVVPSVLEDPRSRLHAWYGREQLTSYVGIPLKSGRRITGVLELLTAEPREFTPDETRLITQFVLKARLGERLDEETTA